jgi:hypothetical protein
MREKIEGDLNFGLVEIVQHFSERGVREGIKT